MDYLSKRYLNQISGRLRNFNWTGPTTASCSCPVCGDSKKNLRKTRGSFYDHKGTVFFHCYNCGVAQNFSYFLQQFDSGLYQEYRLDLLKESGQWVEPQQEIMLDVFETGFKAKEEHVPFVLTGLKELSTLASDHPARVYVEKRKLPMSMFMYCPNFPKWASGTFKQLEKWSKASKHPRLIIPIYNSRNEFIGMQARAFGNEAPKYCTLRLREDEDFFYGLDRLDKTKKTYVVEGPIDSLMLDNSIAVMSSALERVQFNNVVYIYDNENRNEAIVKLIKKTIDNGRTLVIWPEWFKYKDLNEAIVAGMSKSELKEIIDSNTFNGMTAQVKFNEWKRVK